MYQPSKYRNDDRDFIFKFIQDHPFATVIIQGKHLLATHIPILVSGSAEKFRLFGHIANHNPMRGSLEENGEILVVFKGPDAYVSSSWYGSPDIPTWDYTAVHINATIHLQTSKELENSLKQLILHFEKNSVHPLDPTKIPESIWNENFHNITGFWLEPFICVGIEKLHQGFEKIIIENIVQQLNQVPDHQEGIGELLKKKHRVSN